MQDTLKSSAKRYYGLYHDRKANERNLNVGDKVLILLFKTICLKNGRDHSRLLVPTSVMTFLSMSILSRKLFISICLYEMLDEMKRWLVVVLILVLVR